MPSKTEQPAPAKQTNQVSEVQLPIASQHFITSLPVKRHRNILFACKSAYAIGGVLRQRTDRFIVRPNELVDVLHEPFRRRRYKEGPCRNVLEHDVNKGSFVLGVSRENCAEC